MASKQWRVKKHYPGALDVALKKYPPVFRQLAYNRGFSDAETLKRFLHPSYTDDVYDPFLFHDMRKAVNRVQDAIKRSERITLYADYDADGVCGAAILSQVLEKYGAEYDVYLPHRQEEGYGLNKEALDTIIKRGTTLIITIDCGISNNDETAYARQKGADVIITDHHQQMFDTPDVCAVLHPSLDGETYPDKRLCGGGVAYKFAQALIEEHAHSTVAGFDKWLLDLAAIATVADYGEVFGENRAFIKYGLIVLNKTRNKGLQHLLRVAHTNGSMELDSFYIAMRIVPLINAAGRMNHANMAYDLLMAQSDEEAALCAQALKQENIKRQQLTEVVYTAAKKQIAPQENESLLIAREASWPITILGIVASRLMNEYSKPTALIGRKKDRWAGSVRSTGSLHAAESLRALEERLESYGGHPRAAGFTLKENEDIDAFIREWQNKAADSMDKIKMEQVREIDAEMGLDEIDEDFIDWLQTLKPFGPGNPRPTFLLKNILVKEQYILGKNNTHLKLIVARPSGGHFKVIFFGGAEIWAKKLIPETSFNAVVELDYNVWNGISEIQIKVVDIELC